MHVMLTLDESGFAQTILRWFKVFPHPKDTRVSIVHVLEPLDIPDAVGASGRRRLEQQQEAGAEAMLAKAVRFLDSVYPNVQVLLRDGLPIYEILRLVRDLRPDVVVSGTRGLMGAKGLVLGSVSQRLLHYSPCSVMLLPAKATLLGRLHVMMATDGSAGAKNAARFVADLPDIKKVTLVAAVQTLDPGELAFQGVSREEWRRNRAQLLRWRRDAARKALESTVGVLARSTAPVRTRIVLGHPAKAIPEAARKDGCDLLVVGSRGLTGMKAVALGSVSYAVAQTATCPVLIVKP